MKKVFKYSNTFNELGSIYWTSDHHHQILLTVNGNLDNLQIYPKLEKRLNVKKHYDDGFKLMYMIPLDGFVAVVRMLQHYLDGSITFDEILDFFTRTKHEGMSINRTKYHNFFTKIELADWWPSLNVMKYLSSADALEGYLNGIDSYTLDNPNSILYYRLDKSNKIKLDDESLKSNNNSILIKTPIVNSEIVQNINISNILDMF
jgi:hypothetical protein